LVSNGVKKVVQVGMYIHTQYKTIHIYCHVRENKQTKLDNKGEKVTANSGMITLTDI